MHLLAIDEQPAWHDPAVGRVFADMRMTLGCSVDKMARQIGTTADVIMLLEAGRLRALPAW